MDHTSDPELQLLRRARLGIESLPGGGRLQHELQNAPLFTRSVLTQAPQVFQQRGLLGTVLQHQGQEPANILPDERIYVNTSAPCSAIVCGVQGSGKSHTVSCLLEGSLIADRHIGALPEPLSAVVFHFDEDNGDRPCEAAFLAVPHQEHPLQSSIRDVTVLVSPSNLQTRTKVYAQLPKVNVQPLYLSESNLNAGRMLSMMGCDDIERMPLYMHTALSILRRMGSDDFDYGTFKQQLNESDFTLIQRSMLKMRTDLLDSYLSETAPSITSWFDHGKLVIVDLSDPFLDGTTASTLFDIVLGVFVEWRSQSQRNKKIVVLDEAHKYLSNSDNARLTKTLSSLIRQQRHLGIRIIISTQEPTVVPATILDLASYIICHRFSSPSWCTHLKRHVSLDSGDTRTATWVQEVMQLHTGEALLFSPNAVVSTTGPSNGAAEVVTRLSAAYLKILTRPRITLDGGFSIMAVDPGGLPNTEISVPIHLSSDQASVSSLPAEISPPLEQSRLPSPARQTSTATSFTKTASPIQKASSSIQKAPSPTQKAQPPIQKAPSSTQKASSSAQKASSSTQKAPSPTQQKASSSQKTPSTLTNGAQVSDKHAKNPALVSTAATERPFRELIAALESLKKDGIKRPPRKQVSLRLRQMQLTIYHESGFKHYLSVAAAGGYVKIGGGLPNEKKWVSLP